MNYLHQIHVEVYYMMCILMTSNMWDNFCSIKSCPAFHYFWTWTSKFFISLTSRCKAKRERSTVRKSFAKLRYDCKFLISYIIVIIRINIWIIIWIIVITCVRFMKCYRFFMGYSWCLYLPCSNFWRVYIFPVVFQLCYVKHRNLQSRHLQMSCCAVVFQ